MHKIRIKKVIALVATVSILSVTAFSNIAFAAQSTTSATAQTTTSQLNQEIVNNALAMIDKAVSSNKQEDMDIAKAYLKTLTPKEMVAVYAKRMESYYLSNYYKDGFPYFNVSKYIKMHNDVREAAAKSNQPLLFAMNHYLYFGILEGRSSCTDFDPMVAILVDSRCAIDAVLKPSPTIDDVKASFKALTGKESTSGYTIVYSSSGEILSAKPITGSGVSGGSTGGGYIPAPTPTPTPSPQRIPTYINKNTAAEVSKLVTYKFYDNKDLAVNQSILVGNGVKGTFYGTNYQTVRDTGKKYTMMYYMTASDLEMNDAVARISAEITSMMKAGNLDNVNVLLCVGGSGKNSNNISYYNDYMQNEIAESGLGIYYLNLNGLDDSAKETLRNISSEDLLLSINAGKTKGSKLCYDNFINEKTLVKLFTTSNSKLDMGDPGILTGFINLCSQLYPADDYGLNLSNHGCGLVGGVCINASEKEGIDFPGTSLIAQELEAALSSTDIFKNTDSTGTYDGKLGLLFYDACLMGSSELAYLLKDYYRYMIASEEEVTCWTDQYKFLTALNEAATGTVDDRALAVKLMSDFKDTSWRRGLPYKEGTIAVYSSNDIEETIRCIGSTSEKIADLLDKDTVGISGTLSFKVFCALRKAIMSCSDYAAIDATHIRTYVDERDYMDIGEFLTYLKSDLSAVAETLDESIDKQKLQDVITSLNDTLCRGFLINSNMYFNEVNAVDSFNNQSIISFAEMNKYYSDFWKTWCGTNAGYYGASIFFPFDASVSALEGSHYTDYEGSGLQGYINLLKKYIEVYPNSKFSDQSEMIRLMKTLDIEEIASPTSEAEIKKIGGAEFMVINFNSIYDSSKATQNEIAKVSVSGSPMQDLMMAAEKMEIAITGTNGDLYTLSALNGEALHLDSNQITIDIADIKYAKAYFLTSSNDDNLVKVYIPLSQLEFSVTDKKLAQEAAKSIIKDEEITTFKGALGKENSGVITPIDGDVYHIFSSYNRKYLCTVRETGDDKKYELVPNSGTFYDRIKCYSYKMNNSNSLEVDSSKNQYGKLDSSYDEIDLFRDFEYAININDACLSVSFDGVNFTEEKRIQGATPVSTNTSDSGNSLAVNTSNACVESSNTVTESTENHDFAQDTEISGISDEFIKNPETMTSSESILQETVPNAGVISPDENDTAEENLEEAA